MNNITYNIPFVKIESAVFTYIMDIVTSIINDGNITYYYTNCYGPPTYKLRNKSIQILIQLIERLSLTLRHFHINISNINPQVEDLRARFPTYKIKYCEKIESYKVKVKQI
jgi:hypothetical protein